MSAIDDFNADYAARVDRIRRAFAKSLARATWPVVWDCSRGMHEPFFTRIERAERAARNWKLAAKALRSLAIMAGVRKSFYRPYSLRRWR